MCSLFRSVFVSYLVWGILVEIVLALVGVLHLASLRAAIDSMTEGASQYGGELNHSEIALERSYKVLVAITLSYFITTSEFLLPTLASRC